MSLFAGQDSRLFCRNPPSYLIRVVSTDPVTQISPTVILNRYMGCHVLFPLPGPSITHTHTHTYFLLALPTPCAATAATNPCLLTSSRRSTCRATSCPPYCVCSELQGSYGEALCIAALTPFLARQKKMVPSWRCIRHPGCLPCHPHPLFCASTACFTSQHHHSQVYTEYLVPTPNTSYRPPIPISGSHPHPFIRQSPLTASNNPIGPPAQSYSASLPA
ncbi:hypothetical protein NEUTE1DRAFT_122973 [Neurospora tetrasperma FGSC 2508]|uniref:Uncharacterized protein n=1 Tax=Neurospora tetrasperma (strain FGSC 2508 / ATCC MYA-4615 / P0657) TaxID=510951 RepID=F8MQ02_NEUT8|nr:uncharacterized protein NEUTE1DRAFT_122973 [Neurospora tetrasperma FGSC 2508]EGO56432.1 hypothetical protein NEUTE1DRAFT_122973 [Neurospora tetrasperma FGSC 2508]